MINLVVRARPPLVENSSSDSALTPRGPRRSPWFASSALRIRVKGKHITSVTPYISNEGMDVT